MSNFIVQDRSGVRRVPIGRQMAIGRSQHSDLVLHSTFASRRHAWVWRQGDRLILEDLGSTHGTFVNGQPLVTPRFLCHNDVVAMGDARLVFVENQGRPENRLPAGPGPRSQEHTRTPPGGTPRWMVSQLFCPRCNSPNPPRAEFCESCGQPLGWIGNYQGNWGPQEAPGRAYYPITPAEPVAARPFPGALPPAQPRMSRGMWVIILVLAILAVVLLTVAGVLVVLLLG